MPPGPVPSSAVSCAFCAAERVGRPLMMDGNAWRNPGKALAAEDAIGVDADAVHGECMHKPRLIVASHERLNCQPVFDGLPTAREANPGAAIGLTTWSRKYSKLAGELNARLNVKRRLFESSYL